MGSTTPCDKMLLCFSGRRVWTHQGRLPKNVHWRPTKLNHGIDHDQTALGFTKLSGYEKFDQLIHVTHLRQAAEIVKTKKIEAQTLTSPTLANSKLTLVTAAGSPETRLSADRSSALHIYRRLGGFCGLWITPACSLNTYYGSIAFNVSIHSIATGDFNYYWIEIIEYTSKSASRILVIPKKSDPYVETLKSLAFDPKVRGGPWYYNVNTGEHYALKRCRSYWEFQVPARDHTLEFLKSTDIVWPSEIPSWSAVLHMEDKNRYCKRYPKGCFELKDRLGVAKSSLCMWAHIYLEGVAPGTSLGKRKRSDPSVPQTFDDGVGKRQRSASELEKDVDDAVEFFLDDLYEAPSGEECSEDTNQVHWSKFVSCLKDQDFDGASEAISNVPYEFVYEEMRYDFPRMPEKPRRMKETTAALNEDGTAASENSIH
ncbi:hypothetical protein BC832DRAFT_563357 [Gaertneriomyces semiglobifer]|nr:hypothetical protein BC832DRAFT_563357 [Gaertneriomyces semiglobifer]